MIFIVISITHLLSVILTQKKMDFKIAFTDKEITAWGGMIFMKKLIEKSGITEKLNEVELPSQGLIVDTLLYKLLKVFG